jgi:hypothetical protein
LEEAWACGRQAPFPCHAASVRAAPAVPCGISTLHTLRTRYACPSRAASARAAPALAAGMGPPHTLRIRCRIRICHAYAASYATHTLPHTLRIRLIRYAYATCACCSRFCQSFMSPASPRGCTPDIRFCTHRLRCQYAYATHTPHTLRIRQTFASALTASGVGICTFVLVKQVRLY